MQCKYFSLQQNAGKGNGPQLYSNSYLLKEPKRMKENNANAFWKHYFGIDKQIERDRVNNIQTL